VRAPGLDRRRLLLAALGALLAACLAVVAAGQWWLHQQRSEVDRTSDVRDAAETAVTAVLSYDYRRLQPGMDETTPLLTGDAKKQYVELQQPLLTSAPKLRAVVQAEVRTTTVLQSDDDSARVLLFVDQTSTSKKLTEPQLDQSRVLVTLERSGDHWLVSTLAAI
jgi:Mce-associated membrane protein